MDFFATDRETVLWSTGDWAAQTISGYGSAAFSCDSQLLALGGTDIKLIDPSSRKELRTIELPALAQAGASPGLATHSEPKDRIPCIVSALATSLDNATLAVGCPEGTLRILKLQP